MPSWGKKSARLLRTLSTGLYVFVQVPSAFVVLDSFPFTPSGKVDRKALPAPHLTRSEDLETGFVAPRNPTERRLADLMSQVLGLASIGVFDNFHGQSL